MDNMIAVEMPQDVREELYALLDELTPSQVSEYARRVEAGEVDGASYGEGTICGCAYGTAALIIGVNPVKFTETRTYKVKPGGITPLERFVELIDEGDTPKTFDASAALYAACLGYMAQRQRRIAAVQVAEKG